MNTITIQTKEGEFTYELASFFDRLIARIIDSVIMFIPNFFIPLIPSWLYWSLMQSSNTQSTLGQRAMGIKLVSTIDGKVSFGRATGRFFANFLNILSFLLGYFMMFFNDKNQCLHDYMTKCVVVKSKEISRTDSVSEYFVSE